MKTRLFLISSFAYFFQFSDFSTISAQVATYYYQGDHRVDVTLKHDALLIESDAGLARTNALVRTALPTADITSSTESGNLVVRTKSNDVTELNTQVATLRAALPNATIRAILSHPNATGSDQDQYLTDRISFKVSEGASVADIATRVGLSDVEPVTYSDNTFTAKVNPKGKSDVLASLTAANALQENGIAEWASPLIARQMHKRSIPNDPLFSNQWHLLNTGLNASNAVAGNDLNIASAWDLSTGLGVNLAIADDGMETTHPDLMANVRLDLCHDFNSNDNDPTPQASYYYGPPNMDSHGTACAGVSAGKANNGIGISGTAPDASLVGLRLIAEPTTDQQEADGMNWKVSEANPLNQVFINSNSWGPSDNGRTLEGPGPLTAAALANGVTNGRNGKGTVYVWAAGNGRQNIDNVNKDGYANNPNVIAIGATSAAGTYVYYGEQGAAILVNAPSSYSTGGITTSDLSGAPGYTTGDYTSTFGGTSSAAPAAAGVVGLILAANPALTYRDVMQILVHTATRNDPAEAGWFNNGAGLHYNHNYGFGRINAYAAVLAAQNWVNVPPLAQDLNYQYLPPSGIAIPDNTGTSISVELPITAPGNFSIEHVELETNIIHSYRGDLRIQLQSPQGTVSQLMTTGNDNGQNYLNWKFRSVAHWDENPTGTWKVWIQDNFTGDAGTLNSLKLRIMGHVDGTSSAKDWDLY